MHKSLLRRADGNATSTGRYELHELLRQFAAEQLQALPDERAAVQARHSTFYLQFVAERKRRLARNELHEAAAEIQSELDNVRQAWAWAAEHEQVAALEGSAYAVWQFHTWIGLIAECQHIFRLASERITALCEHAGDDVPARRIWERSLSTLLAIQAHCLSQRGRYEEALAKARLAIVLGETNGNMNGEMLGYLVWGQVRTYTGNNQEARSMLEQALHLAGLSQEGGVSSELVNEVQYLAHVYLSGVALRPGDHTSSKQHIDQALQLCRSRASCVEKCSVYSIGGRLLRIRATIPRRVKIMRQRCTISQHLGYRWGTGAAQLDVGDMARLQGEYGLALDITSERSIFCAIPTTITV